MHLRPRELAHGKQCSVLYGSANSRPSIVRGIGALLGTKIESLSPVGEIPELVVHLSNGHCLRSIVMATGGPEWNIRLPDENHVSTNAGTLLVGKSGCDVTPQEDAAFARAETAVARWRTPSAEPKRGRCMIAHGLCQSMARAIFSTTVFVFRA